MDRLEAMSLLLDTVDMGSFSAAARKRGMPTATLTRKVDQLERCLGAVLLLRSTRRLTLTDAGHLYVAGTRTILAHVSELEREAAGEFAEPTGRLVIAAPQMFGRKHVLPIITEFLKDYPGISIDLRLADDNADLTAGAADLAIRIGDLPDSNLIATRIGSMRSIVVAAPSLLKRYAEPRDVNDSAELPVIALDMPMPSILSHPHIAATTTTASRVRLVVPTAEAALDAAVAGIGIVHLLHYQVADAINAGVLLPLTTLEGPASPVHILHAPLAQLPLKMRCFLDVAKSSLRESLRQLSGQ